MDGVMKKALHVAHLLPAFEEEGNAVQDVISLQRKSPFNSPYYWQDKAAAKISEWYGKRSHSADGKRFGFFAVNLASTGCGKTFGNAKIMQSLAQEEPGLRYILALGLRALTLQTGTEYRKRIGLDDTELAVIIGSTAFKELFNQQSDTPGNYVEAMYSLFDGEVDYAAGDMDDEISVLLKDKASRQLLNAPVLSCTIDYIIAATETKKGGRWMLPFLRLMSSDLVIDEIDDFSGDSLIAIGRLINLAGMLGRKVVIASATIPPDMAEGYFRTYQQGWTAYAEFHNLPKDVGCAWIDEFTTRVETNSFIQGDRACESFRTIHYDFCRKRVRNLKESEAKNGARRRARIVPCQMLRELGRIEQKEAYCELIKENVIALHDSFCVSDSETGKNVSFGCVRIAHVNDCIDVAQALIKAEYPEDYDVRVMAYHSRQVLLLRSSQERHLDAVLSHPEEYREKSLSHPTIRYHLDTATEKNIIFIVVATPVEEEGRDHDFDWAVIEPSSFRSIIQLAGRVRRHRAVCGKEPNIHIMQYNLKGLSEPDDTPVFCHPGYESNQNLLKSHDVSRLVNEKMIRKSINSAPRIIRDFSIPLNHQENLADLEHYVTSQQLTNYHRKGPDSLEGWLSDYWFLTALPQEYCPFRTHSSFLLYYSFDSDDNLVFGTYDKEFIPQEHVLNIRKEDPVRDSPKHIAKRFWLHRDYTEQLDIQVELTGKTRKALSLRYGEIEILKQDNISYCYSDQFGLKFIYKKIKTIKKVKI